MDLNETVTLKQNSTNSDPHFSITRSKTIMTDYQLKLNPQTLTKADAMNY